MSNYYYRAVGRDSSLHQGRLDASSLVDLRTKLNEQGLSLISASRLHKILEKAREVWARKVKLEELRDFYIHLKQFEDAGIPLTDSLKELSLLQENQKLKHTLSLLLKDLEGGLLLSIALAKHPHIFDRLALSLMNIGEKTGQFSSLLTPLIQHVEWQEKTSSKIEKSLRYPFILIGIVGMTFLIFMGSLIPELTTFLYAFKVDLPYSARVLIAFSKFLSEYLFLIIIGISAGYLFIKTLFALHSQGPLWKSHILDMLPIVGKLQRLLMFSYFFQSLSLLSSAQIDILEALAIARQTSPAQKFNTVFINIEKAIREGVSLSEAFERGAIFPPLVNRMLKVGEKTSTLPLNLQLLKNYFETLSQRRIDRFISLLEPCILLIIACILGWIVSALFIPLYETLTILDYQ